ncbi:TIGR03032 family protein [Sphingomonas faeni]|uniref:TIGR03032 family protein n=1 Tax=Sphingomonas faeni TaxID=185950 RepID=UPI0033628406
MTSPNPPPSLQAQVAARERTTINVSKGLAELLVRLRMSLAFTSYQSGQLFLVGVDPEDRVAIDQQHFERAMGIHWNKGRLHLATGTQIIRFEDMLLPGERADGRNDAVLVPRLSWTTNDVDAHELSVDVSGRPLFVATRFNCIATVDDRFSFSPVWMPGFLNGSDRGDRCHLNGMALVDGALACVSMVSTTDEVDGWRAQRNAGGVIMECRTGRSLVSGLSMPHSPRLYDGALWFLEAGRGALATVELATGVRRDVAFLPGFARGLDLVGTHALLTVSKPRDARFDGLQLDHELASRGESAWCGVLVVNLENGSIDGWIRFEGPIQELFDVVALPGVRCPRSLAPGTREIWDNVRPRPRSQLERR